jgi:carbon monoxide dehydrogenase subunit G
MIVQFPISIVSSPEHVWSLLSEPEQQKKWMTGLVENKSLDEGPTKPGSRIEFVIKEGNRQNTYSGVITQYSPVRELGLKFWGGMIKQECPIGVHYQLTPDNGGTLLNYSCELDTSNLNIFLRLLSPLLKVFNSMMARKQMNNLKKLAEGK